MGVPYFKVRHKAEGPRALGIRERRLSQFLSQDPGRGPREVGSGEEPIMLRWIVPPRFQPQNVRQVQRKRASGQVGKKRKFIRGKREGDWLLRRTSVLLF